MAEISAGVFILVAVLVAQVASLGRKQRVSVKGEVFCPSDPGKAHNIKVKLVDEDSGPDPDDDMDEGYTDNQGRFTLSGTESEWTSIDPRVKIYHDCNDGLRPCQRKWKITIPDLYINKDTFDMGRLNLEMVMDEEERDCIH